MTSKFAGLALAVDAPARMTILHPVTRQPLRDSAGEEAWIDLLSADSAAARAHDRAITDALIRAGARRRSAEQMDAELTDKLAKLTTGWRLLTLDGEPIDVPFSVASAREMYALPELAWLRGQVMQFVDDLGNFRPAASTS